MYEPFNKMLLSEAIIYIIYKSLSEENFRRKKGGWGVFF